ncbi:g6462 [Coccomyxa viridis]|uniref:G6462 protein n=1 Tax=Coccomyxa viridis TaxID=1274662 RepID=A0ABP1G0B9_9CHLO
MKRIKDSLLAAISLLTLSGALAADRQLLQALAPGPVGSAGLAPAPTAGPQKAADGVFVYEATSVTFINATSMVLSGLPNNTAYVQYPPRVEAGTIDTDVFFSTQMAEPTSNEWVGGPQALLQGTLNNTSTNVIVIMNAPVYDANSGNVTAIYQLFNSTASHLPSSGGVANSVLSTVASSSTGSSSPAVTTNVPAATEMANVTFFVDVANITQYTKQQASSNESSGGQKARVVVRGGGVGRVVYRATWPVYNYYNPYYYG